MRLLLLFLLMLPGTLMVCAEEGAEAKKAPPRQMRLLTVGERPPFRQEIRDGVRYELPPPPGSLPPVELEVSIPTDDGKEEESGSLRIRLGSISPAIQVPGGAGEVVLRPPGGDAGSRPWSRVKRPENGDFVVILWRGAEPGTWDEPTSFVMPTELPPGKATLVNVAPGPVAVIYQEERIALPSGRPILRSLLPGKPLGLQVGMPKGNRLQRLISRSIEQGRGQHSLVVFYRADGDKPRSPIGIKVVRLGADTP
jgi:hypothetical protein